MSSPSPSNPTLAENNHAIAMGCVEVLGAHPDYLLWHYVRAAVVHHGSISQASKVLHMHRRTVQRIVGRKCPPMHPVLPE